MAQLSYPATFTENELNGFNVQFKDIPEAFTFGEDFDDAKEMAFDILLCVIEDYRNIRKPFPMPSTPEDGDVLIDLPILAVSKVLLFNTMIQEGVSQAELARRMGKSSAEINRLVDARLTTKFNTIEDAFTALGKKLTLCVE